jgi:hypothetical protein
VKGPPAVCKPSSKFAIGPDSGLGCFTVDAGFRGLHRIVLVMNRRSRTRKIIDFVNLDVERECRIVAKKLESFVRQQRSRIGARAGKKIIDAKHIRSVREQPLAEMGAKEPGATIN